MAKIHTLKDRDSGTAIYPVTSSEAVIDPQGRDLETRLAAERTRTDNKFENYAKTTELTEGLKGKQDALATSAELSIDGDNMIGLTERGRLAAFIDMWNARCCVSSSSNNAANMARNTFGRYNPETGFFELNGLTDITYEQAREIMRVPATTEGRDYCYSRARTLFSFPLQNTQGAFSTLPNAEVVRLVDYYIVNNGADPDTELITINNTRDMFSQCWKLREVRGVMRLVPNDAMGVHLYGGVDRCENLETIWLHSVQLNMKIAALRRIRLECVRYMVDNAANTKAITVTVHADVYAKLTGDTANEAAAALTAEELAQWQQVAVNAAAKNISFATT